MWYRSIITSFFIHHVTIPAWFSKLKDRWRQKRAERDRKIAQAIKLRCAETETLQKLFLKMNYSLEDYSLTNTTTVFVFGSFFLAPYCMWFNYNTWLISCKEAVLTICSVGLALVEDLKLPTWKKKFIQKGNFCQLMSFCTLWFFSVGHKRRTDHQFK